MSKCPKCGKELPLKTLIGKPWYGRDGKKVYCYCENCGAVTSWDKIVNIKEESNYGNQTRTLSLLR